MSLRHALLGLLHEAPGSGYDLLQIFKLSLGHTWPATQSQVYTELTKLADAGLIAVTAQGPRGRKEYAVTDDGLAELRRWLVETEPEIHPRSEALLRVFLLGSLTRDQARGYLTWLGERAREDVAAFEALDASVEWNDEEISLHGRLVLEYGRRLAAMSREWAQWAAEQIPTTRSELGPAEGGGAGPAERPPGSTPEPAG